MKVWIPTILALALMVMSCGLWQPYTVMTGNPIQEPTQIEIPTQQPTQPASPTPKICTVIASEALNLRSGPGMAYQVKAWLSPGDLLTITRRPSSAATSQQRDGWANVTGDPKPAA